MSDHNLRHSPLFQSPWPLGLEDEVSVAQHEALYLLRTGSPFSSAAIPRFSGRQPVGCTLVVHRQHEPILSASVFNVSIPSSELKTCAGAFSISPNALFSALQEHFASLSGVEFSIDPLILTLLQCSSRNHSFDLSKSTIKTATCRIPAFSAEHLASNMQDPNFGFVMLSQSGHPGDYPFINGLRVVSIGSALHFNSYVKHFSMIWGPSGLQLDFHFLLIFVISPTSMSPPSPPTISLPSAAASTALISQNEVCAWTTPLSPPNMQLSAFGNPAFYFPSVIPADAVQLEEEAPSSANTAEDLSQFDFIKAVLSLSTSEEQASAFFVPSLKSFFLIGRNWYSMRCILDKARQMHTGAHEDHKHREAAILQHFNWSATTYRNKTQLFEWALDVSKLSWVGEKAGASAEVEEYWRFWKGISFLFKDGGAIQQNRAPRRSATGEELWATQLSQSKATLVKRFLTNNSSVFSSSRSL